MRLIERIGTFRGINISTCKRLPIFILMVASLNGCVVKAPKNHYLEFALFRVWGETNRQNTGRAVDEIITPPEKLEPLVLAFEQGESPSGLIELVKHQPEPTDIDKTKSEIATEQNQSAMRELPKIPIALSDKALQKIFRDEQIGSARWRLVNGRFDGGLNVVHVNFIPSIFSEEAIQDQFLRIMAIVNGAQMQKNSVDLVRATAEYENGTPIETIEGRSDDYIGYINQKLDRSEWHNRLRIHRYR